MNKQSHINVPIETRQFLSLVDFLKTQKSDRDPVTAISVAIDYWLENASWKPELLPEKISISDLGYRWKEIILPHGTKIRMKYKGEFYYALVEGDKIIYEDNNISPSELANKISGTSRNAWRDLWIKKPDDDDWHLAYDIRAQIKKAK